MRASVLLVAALSSLANAQGPYSMDQIKSYPFPNGLTAAGTGSRIAWALNDQGKRNVWVAEGPSFEARQLTDYSVDDGQEITSLQVSKDGRWVVFLRGGDFSSNFDDAQPVNVLNQPTPPRVQILSVPFDRSLRDVPGRDVPIGSQPMRPTAGAKVLGEGEDPVISPTSDRVAFVKDRAIWVVPVDGATPHRREGRQRLAYLVAERKQARVRGVARRSRVHRYLRERLHEHDVDRADDVARR